MAAALISSLKAIESGAMKRGNLSGAGLRRLISSDMTPWCHPRSDRGQLLGVGLRRGEEIATLGDALRDRADRPAVGTQLRVVEFVPCDRGRHRGPLRRPDRVWRNERL